MKGSEIQHLIAISELLGNKLPPMVEDLKNLIKNDPINHDFTSVYINSSKVMIQYLMRKYPKILKNMDESFKYFLNQIIQLYAFYEEKPDQFTDVQKNGLKVQFISIINYYYCDRKIEIDEDMMEKCDTQLQLKDIDEVTELQTSEEAKNPTLEKPKI